MSAFDPMQTLGVRESASPSSWIRSREFEFAQDGGIVRVMRLSALTVAALLCAGCDTSVDDNATPAASDVDRLERLLAGHKCIHRLDAWERNYRFSRKSGLLSGHSMYPDLDVIEFHLRRAGTVAILPGRNVLAPKPGGDWPDSRPVETLDGKLALRSGRLSMTPCPPKPKV